MRDSRVMRYPRFAASLALLGLLVVAGNAAAQASDCTMSVSEPVVDYGTLYGDDIARALPTRSVQLTVVCPTAMDLTVFYRGIAASQPARFQLADMGTFALRVRDATVDGQPVDLGDVQATGALPSQIAPTLPLLPGRGLAPYRNGQPVLGMTLSATVDVDTQLEQRASRHVGNGAAIEAHGFFESPAATAKADFGIIVAAAPGPCSITLTNGGVIDLGQIPIADLLPTQMTILNERTMNAQINCGATPAVVAILAIENRPGTQTGGFPNYEFGLGTTAAGKPIGNYVVRVSEANRGNFLLSATNVIQSSQLAGPYQSIGPAPWFVQHSGGAKYLSVGPAAGPPSSQIFVDLKLLILPKIAARNDLIPFDGPVTIDGSMTLELVYP